MNWADYVILGVLGLSLLVGLWRGLISEVMALAVWIAAFWVAWLLGDDVAAWLGDSVTLPSARAALGYAACFIAVLLVGALLRVVLHKLVEGTGLGGTDRLLGLVFGLARGLLLVTLAVLLLAFTPFPRDPWWQESQLIPSFSRAAAWLGDLMPEEMAQYLDLQPLAEATLQTLPQAIHQAGNAELPSPAVIPPPPSSTPSQD